MIDYVHRLSLA